MVGDFRGVSGFEPIGGIYTGDFQHLLSIFAGIDTDTQAGKRFSAAAEQRVHAYLRQFAHSNATNRAETEGVALAYAGSLAGVMAGGNAESGGTAVDVKTVAAANFALQMTVDGRLSNDLSQEALYQRDRSQIAPEADNNGPRVPDNYVGETGGALHRAVAARELPGGIVEVSVGQYDTPGLYAMRKDGSLVKPTTGRDSLQRPRVEFTEQPAADGSKPSAPRWLLMNPGILFDQAQEQVDAVRGPFRPDPFVQEPPNPTSATTG